MIFHQETLQTLLDLPGIVIDRAVFGERKTLKICVHSTREGTHFHHCGQQGHRDFIVVISAYVHDRLRVIGLLAERTKAAVQQFFCRIPNRLFAYSPKLKEVYDACEALTAIYESRLYKGQGKRKQRGWVQRVTNRKLTCLDRFLGTLDAHFEEITNYFVGRHSNGFVEGLNNKLKVLKRRFYGITNLKQLYQRVRLDLSGYTQLGVESA